MFSGCTSLAYINLKNFNEINLNSYSNMFNGVPDNITICINENTTSNKIFPQIRNKSYKVDCPDDSINKDYNNTQFNPQIYTNSQSENIFILNTSNPIEYTTIIKDTFEITSILNTEYKRIIETQTFLKMK